MDDLRATQPASREMLRLRALGRRIGLSKSALYAHMASGLLTPPVKIGSRASAWPSDEVDAILAARMAGRTNDQIRELVGRLITARTGTQTDATNDRRRGRAASSRAGREDAHA